MVGLPKVLYVTLVLLICIGSQVESDDSNHRYNKGDIVPFYANKVGPFHNAQETYAYYDLPFCSPETLIEKKLNLGEMLNGDRLVSAPYKLEFLVDKDYEVLCSKKLSKSDVSQLRSVIEMDYYTQMYYDDLPIWAFIGQTRRNYTDERIKNQYFLYTHSIFEVFYNEDRVIEVTCKMVGDSLVDLTDDKEVNVKFIYSVKWSVTEQSFYKRMEKYIGSAFLPRHLSIHHHSIAYSSVAIFILIICLVTFYVLVLNKDISKNLNDVEEDQVDDDQEATGWKKIHGDVFRFPKHKSLFAAALGSGTHLLLLIVSVLVMGLMGYFQPYVRGVFWNALVIAYAVTSVVSGYTSVSFYFQHEGTTSMKNLLLTAGLYFGPLFLTFGFLNSVAIFYGVTAALPLEAIVILALLLIFLALPLLLLGGYVGKNTASDFHAPCRTSKCPKEIPRLRWYRGLLPQMALAGILPLSVVYVQLYYIFATVWGHRVYTLYTIMFVVFIFLLITTALVSVALTYFQLAAEDHQWWWRSFFCGGSTGLYIYGYGIYYYFCRTDMTGFMQTSFFFGYMACVCYGIFLVLGSVGFRASLLLVHYLYAAIKCD
ncbi:nonaspanin (TM9SF) [Artemisia annua]|uniref:Transmembrane 9 superfamily member n=1 Tax=Artemisia annua TaxID=35608 RepID=A0A2U1NYG2_ARTAN|nr:nonaspanin (TM9SF) [Artemisia annua]